MALIPHRRPVRLALAKGFTAALAFLLLIAAQTDRGYATGQPSAPPLQFFKNYFLTGDYAVAGVGLWGRGVNGFASGSIAMSGVPAGSEIVSAFLYWQSVSADGPNSGSKGAMFNGQLLSVPGPPDTPTPGGSLATVAEIVGTSPCWNHGGVPGFGGGVKRTYNYRADVKRFLPIGSDGRHVVNRSHSILLPDTGNANKMPKTLGASLLVVYRSPSSTAAMNAIVIYDGSYTLTNSLRGMTQILKGFYDPAAVPGKMTHIVGAGQASRNELFVAPGVRELNAFRGSLGSAWDNVTRNTQAVTGDSVTTSVSFSGFGPQDCLIWSAIVYRTAVNDADGDGLLDKWESSSSSLVDPLGNALPNLFAMGADKNHKDLFIEAGYFQTAATTYGGASKPAHTHAPTHAAIKKFGDMFVNAPVTNPDGSTGIRVHLDLGNSFPAGAGDPYLIRGAGARGGESFDESLTQCTRTPGAAPWICQFSDYPGTVGWKSGFRFLRDMPLALSDTDCREADTDGSPLTRCERVFDRERKDIFRYVLFAHALGLPKEDCLVDDPGSPDFGFPDNVCQATNPLFHVPVTNTGVADFPGGDAIITLGGFNDSSGRPVGTDYMQAATLAHELGHTFQLRHGGAATEPNCKPNYLSVMNYLFQLRGLRLNTGPSLVDFSRQQLPVLNETVLPQVSGLGIDPLTGPPAYRTGWYAPPGPGVVASASTKHCDGSLLPPGAPQLSRVDSNSVEETADRIDWTMSSTTQVPLGGQDLNFDGVIQPLNAGFNDWKNIRLNQLGSRRSVGAWFWVQDPVPEEYGAFIGPLSLDVGLADMGLADMGLADMGSGDLTLGDLGRGDLNRGDLGRAGLGLADMGLADMGLADMGLADMGGGDLGLGDSGLGDSADPELDADLAASQGFTPPENLTALVVGLDTNCVSLTPAQCHRIQLNWAPTNLSSETAYQIHRIAGGSIDTGTAIHLATIPKVLGQDLYTYVDTTELPNGVYTYIVAAVFGSALSASNVQITAVNTAPLAVGDPLVVSYTVQEGKTLLVAAPGVLANDSDIDSPTLSAAATVPLVSGTFKSAKGGKVWLYANGSFKYEPKSGYCGPDSFQYIVKDVDPSRTSNLAVVSIEVTKKPKSGKH